MDCLGGLICKHTERRGVGDGPAELEHTLSLRKIPRGYIRSYSTAFSSLETH